LVKCDGSGAIGASVIIATIVVLSGGVAEGFAERVASRIRLVQKYTLEKIACSGYNVRDLIRAVGGIGLCRQNLRCGDGRVEISNDLDLRVCRGVAE
jgi:hypothetical protein